MNILIPMAGLGSRFSKAGYELPKPLIDVAGRPMIERVLANLHIPNSKFVLVARLEHFKQHRTVFEYLSSEYDAEIVTVDKLTEGTACTVLEARKFIDNCDELVIANSDQLVEIDFQNVIHDARARNLEGSILTFIDIDKNPKWSFAKIDDAQKVVEVQEKKAISEYATVGIYYFKHGSDFVDSALEMIRKNDRVNGEFYTCPVYNYMIRKGSNVGIYNIDQKLMHGTGTPSDLEHFLSKSDFLNSEYFK